MFTKKFNLIFATLFYYISPVLNAPLPPDDDDGSLSASEDRRALWSIPWSCLVTIVACTWLSVHPNVPGRKLTERGRVAIIFDRAKTMGIAVLGPEVIIAWAAEQVIVAWKVYWLGEYAEFSLVTHSYYGHNQTNLVCRCGPTYHKRQHVIAAVADGRTHINQS